MSICMCGCICSGDTENNLAIHYMFNSMVAVWFVGGGLLQLTAHNFSVRQSLEVNVGQSGRKTYSFGSPLLFCKIKPGKQT